MTMITGHAITEIEAAHPEAVLDYERQNLREQVARYNRGLAAHAALCERLRVREERLAREEATLRRRVEARLEAGDREGAGAQALRLEQVEEERRENARQRADAEATYRELVASREVAVRGARERIEALKRSLGEVRTHRALAELQEMAAGMHGTIGLCEGTFERVHERLEEERELAVGRVRVARDAAPDPERARADEAEQRALGEDALRRFEAARERADEADAP
jgi:hypothetical protein